MYSVTVKDHIMIAHSLPDPFFGPAQQTHGATFAIEISFMSERLTDKNVVIDIGEAMNMLSNICAELAYKNLDDIPIFKGKLTTTEFMAKHIHDEIKRDIDDHIKLKVVLHEHPRASASYESH